MADAYWKRQALASSAAGLLKRSRPSDFDLPQSGTFSALELQNYLARDNDHGGPGVVKDTKSIGSAYDRYLQSTQFTSTSSMETSSLGGTGLGRSSGGGMSNFSTDPIAMSRSGVIDGQDIGLIGRRPSNAHNGRGMGFDCRVPMDASNGQGVGAGLGRSIGGGMPNFPADPIALSCSEAIDDRDIGLIGRRPLDGRNGREMGFDSRVPIDTPNGRGMGFDGRLPPVDSMLRPSRETMPLPAEASNTLYVEGLPSDCRKREVAHIFRPFVGYKEVRLATKESRHRDEPLILCFVDFASPACAATAMSALQGYKIDEDDSDSPYLRIQFSKFPGPRSGSHGKR